MNYYHSGWLYGSLYPGVRKRKLSYESPEKDLFLLVLCLSVVINVVLVCSIFTYLILVMDHLLFTRKYSYGCVQFKGGLFHFSNVFVFDTLMKSRELKNSGIVCKFKRNSTMVKMY